MNRSITRLLVILLVLLVPVAAVPVEPAKPAMDEKVEGYAEWQKGNLIIVDGQRVRPAQKVKYKKIGGLYDIHLGWEVKAKGTRAADGSLVAREIEAKPNGTAMFESEVLQATNEIEQIWVEEGKMFDPRDPGSQPDSIPSRLRWQPSSHCQTCPSGRVQSPAGLGHLVGRQPLRPLSRDDRRRVFLPCF